MNAPITPPPPPGTAVTRLKNRLLHPWSSAREEASSSLPALVPQRPVGFPSSIAEFLLVFRLRVRRRTALSGEMMERALHMVLVTCKNWFAGSGSHHSGSRKHD